MGMEEKEKEGVKTTEKKEKPWLQEEGKGEELAAEAIAKDHQLWLNNRIYNKKGRSRKRQREKQRQKGLEERRIKNLVFSFASNSQTNLPFMQKVHNSNPYSKWHVSYLFHPTNRTHIHTHKTSKEEKQKNYNVIVNMG